MESHLVRRFAEMSDDALLKAFAPERLTESALALLTAELTRRGLLPHATVGDAENKAGNAGSEASAPPTSYRMLVRGLTPMRAHILLGRLQEEGIDAHLSGAHVTHLEPLWFFALGGVRIFVRSDHLTSAIQIIDATANGSYAVEDAETGPIPGVERIERKRVLGWTIVLMVAAIFGGLSLLIVWHPPGQLLPDSMPARHLAANWIATVAIALYVIFWLALVERMVARQRRPWRHAKSE